MLESTPDADPGNCVIVDLRGTLQWNLCIQPYTIEQIVYENLRVRGLHTDSGMGGGKLGKLMHAYFVII